MRNTNPHGMVACITISPRLACLLGAWDPTILAQLWPDDAELARAGEENGVGGGPHQTRPI